MRSSPEYSSPDHCCMNDFLNITSHAAAVWFDDEGPSASVNCTCTIYQALGPSKTSRHQAINRALSWAAVYRSWDTCTSRAVDSWHHYYHALCHLRTSACAEVRLQANGVTEKCVHVESTTSKHCLKRSIANISATGRVCSVACVESLERFNQICRVLRKSSTYNKKTQLYPFRRFTKTMCFLLHRGRTSASVDRG